jgi:uncharacterized protein YdiU (UPF0061 family)
LIGEVDDVEAALEVYRPEFSATLERLLHAKLGLTTTQPGDRDLFDAMFAVMQRSHVDFTQFFRALGDLKIDDSDADTVLRDMFIDRAAFDGWAASYRARLRLENSSDAARRTAMKAVNPKYVLRNYLAQVAIEKAQAGDYAEVGKLLAVLEHPFDEQPENEAYAALPPDWASHLEVSCSS